MNNEWYKFEEESILSLGKNWEEIKLDTVVFINYQPKQKKVT